MRLCSEIWVLNIWIEEMVTHSTGEFHKQRSSWGCKESNTVEWLTLSFYVSNHFFWGGFLILLFRTGSRKKKTHIYIHTRRRNSGGFRFEVPEKHLVLWKHDLNFCLLSVSFILDKMLADGSDPLEQCWVFFILFFPWKKAPRKLLFFNMFNMHILYMY